MRTAVKLKKELTRSFVNRAEANLEYLLGFYFLKSGPCGDWQMSSESINEFIFNLLGVKGKEIEIARLLDESVIYAGSLMNEVSIWYRA